MESHRIIKIGDTFFIESNVFPDSLYEENGQVYSTKSEVEVKEKFMKVVQELDIG